MARRRKTVLNSNSSKRSRFVLLLLIVFLALCNILQPIYAQTQLQECGKRQVNSETGKTGRDWPWHAAIFDQAGNKTEHICGGSIVGVNSVLTAARCVFHSIGNQITVHVGQDNLGKSENIIQMLKVTKIIIHPEFDITSNVNDIAIVKLSSDIIMGPNIQPVCLWNASTTLKNQFVGMNGMVVGFGKTDNGHVSETLQEVTLTVVDDVTCLENDRQTYEPLLKSQMYCAGRTFDVNACDGDNGDGMFFEIDGAWYIRGITSFIAKTSSGMCDGSKYTVFTDVSKYREWITRFTTPKAWLNNLKPCEDGSIGKETMCNVANRFDHGFMLVGLGEAVTRVPLNGDPRSQVVTARGLTALARDCAEGRIYWSDIDENQILSAKYDGTDRKPLITKNLIVVFGMAVDWISRRLYWTDVLQRTVEVASLENPAIRTVLISNLENPETIAVDAVHSKLFWLHRKHDRTRWIEWSNLDGTERQLFFDDRSLLKLPTSFQVSMAGGELYIIDEFVKLICIDTYTKRIRTIASGLINPYGLAVTENHLYWTVAFTNQLESVSEDGLRGSPIQFSNSSQHAFEIASVTSKCPVFYSPCAVNNGNCPENTICLLNPRAPAGKNCTVLVS